MTEPLVLIDRRQHGIALLTLNRPAFAPYSAIGA